MNLTLARTRHSPTRRSGSSRSTSATSPASSGCSRIPTSSGTRAFRPSHRRGSPRTGSTATSRDGPKARAPVSRCSRRMGSSSASRGSSTSTWRPARARSATWSRERRAAGRRRPQPTARHRLGARHLGLQRVELHIDPENEASIRVAERCGYVREGVLRSLHFKEHLRGDTASTRSPGRPAVEHALKSDALRPCEVAHFVAPFHGRGHRPAARPAARGDRDPARLGP